MDPSEPLLPAEQRLLDALHAQAPCNLIDLDSKPTARDMVQWDDPDRKLRAEFLRRLLLRLHPDAKPKILALRGGHITGILDLTGTTIDPSVVFSYSRIDNAQFNGARFTEDADFTGVTFIGDAGFDGTRFTRDTRFTRATFTGDTRFGGATFTGDTRFDEAAFTKDAKFTGATFTGDTRFGGATFTGYARFGGARFTKDAGFTGAAFTKDAMFYLATFTGEARFGGARFTGYAGFGGTRFTGDAKFTGATFTGNAGFAFVTFTGEAGFGGATFTKDAGFDEATFTKEARFHGATFTKDAGFDEATFTKEARFDGATFTGNARFYGACAASLSFSGADFHRSDLGPIFGGTVDLGRATFQTRLRLIVLCSKISLSDTQLRSGGHLQIHAADIAADGTEFLGRTILTDPDPTAFTKALNEDRRDRIRKLGVFAVGPAVVTSLSTANVGDLVLSSVALDRCRFVGAHGLDKLRIDASCRLASAPGWRRWRPWRFTRRRVIAEEGDWRRRYATWNRLPGSKQLAPLPAAEIAGIYRDLRKGLEDIKNEPGAADFYYGEMEMRRIGHREKPDRPAGTPRAERWLLHAYWAVSGYGLRAWRAFTAVAVLILAAALVFWTIGIVPPNGTTTKADSVDLATGTINYPQEQPTVDGFCDALEFAGRNSIALLRNPGPVPELTLVGTVTDVLLRLLTPVLLGFGLLALRGRTKR
ncbi:pentapeptide repeat-containing protein [Rhodococcus opacus]|uniref:pentapeptide repeat-containing protein n=1 Tax=Rhodococcus opacus TaxID=37919 RepID=UPI0005663A1D|nr:pentapeptide repeat-containing protein [Rhodococcus opacus]UDH01635.1 pentapeptide repeat-containing protein [Rhodococcus opacus PD630]